MMSKQQEERVEAEEGQTGIIHWVFGMRDEKTESYTRKLRQDKILVLNLFSIQNLYRSTGDASLSQSVLPFLQPLLSDQQEWGREQCNIPQSTQDTRPYELGSHFLPIANLATNQKADFPSPISGQVLTLLPLPPFTRTPTEIVPSILIPLIWSTQFISLFLIAGSICLAL